MPSETKTEAMAFEVLSLKVPIHWPNLCRGHLVRWKSPCWWEQPNLFYSTSVRTVPNGRQKCLVRSVGNLLFGGVFRWRKLEHKCRTCRDANLYVLNIGSLAVDRKSGTFVGARWASWQLFIEDTKIDRQNLAKRTFSFRMNAKPLIFV